MKLGRTDVLGKQEVKLSEWLKVRPGVQAVTESRLRGEWSQHLCHATCENALSLGLEDGFSGRATG